MKSHYNLTAIKGAGMQARFIANGVRVSRERFEDIERKARMFGRIECIHTKGKEKPGGKTRRWNYSTARW